MTDRNLIYSKRPFVSLFPTFLRKREREREKNIYLSIYVNPEPLFVYPNPENGISLSDGTDTPVNLVSAWSLFAGAIGSSRDKGLSFLTHRLVTLSGYDRPCTCLSCLLRVLVFFCVFLLFLPLFFLAKGGGVRGRRRAGVVARGESCVYKRSWRGEGVAATVVVVVTDCILELIRQD